MAFRTELDDFGAFCEATYRRAYRTTFAIVRDPSLAADVTQDAYLEACRARFRFRGDSPAEAWLMRILANRAISAVRRRQVRWVDPLPIDLVGRTIKIGDVIDKLSILDALTSLSPDQRVAIVLRYHHDYGYATIARVMGTSAGTVGSWLSRGLDRLAPQLELLHVGRLDRRGQGVDDAS
jgi:RNA polymerase sigma factor (sigma-70 family)